MSKQRIKTIAALCAIAGLLGTANVRANQDTSKSDTKTHHPSAATNSDSSQLSGNTAAAAGAMSGKVHLPSEHANAKKLDELKGKKVVGSDGQDLGKLNDFVIDAQTGKIGHAVISTGGAFGIGDKLRLIKHDKLKADGSGDQLTAQVDKAEFEAMQVVDEKDLKAGRISGSSMSSSASSENLEPTGRQDSAAPSIGSTSSTASTDTSSSSADRSASSIGSTADTATAAEPTPSASSTGSVASTTTQPSDASGAQSTAQHASGAMMHGENSVLASNLKGKDLRSGNEEIGEIENVAIDLQQGIAMAVVKVESAAAAGGDNTFHVPFESLQISSTGADSVSTTLARTDFTQVQSSSQASTSASTSTSTTDEALSPTGRTSTSQPSSGTYGATSSSQAPATSPEDPAASQSATTGGALSSTSSTSASGSTSASHSTGSTPSQSADPYGSTASSTPASTSTTSPYSSSSSSTATQDASSSGSLSTTGNASSTPSSTRTSSPYDTGVSSTATQDASTSGSLSATGSASTSASSPTSSATSSDIAGANTSSASSTQAPDYSTSSKDSSQSVAGTSGTSSSVGTTSTSTQDEQLTATGRESMGTAAQAIRSALNADQTLASEDVRVQETGRKIMLQGKVSSEDVKTRIETLAKQAAGSAEVDSKLKVEKQK